MKYFNQINIPVNPLIDTYDLSSQVTMHERIDIANVNPDLISLFRTKNIEIKMVECFYRKPMQCSSIHIDRYGGDYIKFNWVYGGKNSIMRWFEVNEGISNNSILTTTINTPYISYKVNEVTQKCVTKTDPGTYIVQVGVPHQVVNFNEPRHCLSMVPYINDQRITMDQAVILFKEFWC
jgi:hypothetical protein